MKLQEVLPVLVSIVIIILVAVLQRQSRQVAAITATMPVNITLALWIVSASSGNDRVAMTDFSRGLLVGMVPTVFFVMTAFLAFRAGLKLVPALAVGYGVWAIVLVVVLGLRKMLGL